MRVLYLDCFSGISGDMTVGALCDLGVRPSTFEWELSKLELGDYHAHWGRESRMNIEGVKFSIHEGATHTHGQGEEEEAGGGAHGHSHEHEVPHEHGAHGHPHEHHEHEHHGGHGQHGHGHEHHHHADEGHAHGLGHSHDGGEHHHHHHHGHADHAHGRSYREIKALIEGSDLSPFVKKHAIGIFDRIAIAEGKIHGTKPEDAQFHEVGALDSIADIVFACVGLEALKVDRIIVSPLAEGRGWIEVAHGRFPIPTPATLEILSGIPLGSFDEPFEFITPTGAAIVAEFAHSFGPLSGMKVEKIGYGVGTRKLQSRPNVLRAVLGEAVDPVAGAEVSRVSTRVPAVSALPEAGGMAGYERDTILRLETNLDDLSPEILAGATTRLLETGALDVFTTPIQMKKGRPAALLTVLCEEAALPALAAVVFRETTSFGLRMDRVERLKLSRGFRTVETPFGPVTVKLGTAGGQLLQCSPEYESCRVLSEKTGQPLRAIYAAALSAAGG